jgi:hypothetical protein
MGSLEDSPELTPDLEVSLERGEEELMGVGEPDGTETIGKQVSVGFCFRFDG